MKELKYKKELQIKNEVLLEAKIGSLDVRQVKKTGRNVTFGKFIVNESDGATKWIDFIADDINNVLSKNKENDLKVGDIIQVVGYLKERPNEWVDKNTGEVKRGVKTSIVGIKKIKIIERFVKQDIIFE